jgi:hypothetical protein
MIMMINRLYVRAPVLTGCAVAVSAYFMRHYHRRQEARRHTVNVHTWEGEGGKPSSYAARPAHAG